MHFTSIVVSALVALPSYVNAAKLHGVVIYSRHGDRQSKVYKGYQVTPLGAEQVYSSGSFYRARYVAGNATNKIDGISSDEYKPTQMWVSAPDQAVLLQTATNFLQGLYPPLSRLSTTLATQELANGTETSAPLGGYQFVQIHAEDEKDPDTIWLKGSDSCPAWNNASATYRNNTDYIDLVKSSQPFYAQFNDVLKTNLPPSKISYANAYDVFDLINVATIHNKSDLVTPQQLNQLRYYANEWESNMNYNASQPGRSLGGATLGGAFLKQLNETVASQGSLKFSLMTGSYNTFLQFFGLTKLQEFDNNFKGLPDYASTMVFELFSETNGTAFPAEQDLKVRFLFRNGTDSQDELTAYPLFGQSSLTLAYPDFRSRMQEFAITTPKQWCSSCGQTSGFCSQPEFAATPVKASETPKSSGGGISKAVAGVIGAVVTLGVVALLGALFFVLRRRKNRVAAPASGITRKTSKDGEVSSTNASV